MNINHWLIIAVMAVSAQASAEDPIPNVSKGKIERVTDFASVFVPNRYLNVWLPPGYTDKQKYDVLYMHDGRMLFDANTTWNGQEWQVDEVAGTLIEQQKVRPFIVVGIPNAGNQRHSEYFPQRPFESLAKQTQQQLYQLERATGQPIFSGKVFADNYLKFLIQEVIPYIEAHYSVNGGGEHRYIGGSSMGGLISWYGLMEYPNEFAGAICMSTHWPGTFSADDPPFAAFVIYIDKNLPKLSKQKLYFDHGDATLDALYQPLQSQIDTLFVQHSYPADLWTSLFFPGENHSEAAWSKRLAKPLQFMFGQK